MKRTTHIIFKTYIFVITLWSIRRRKQVGRCFSIYNCIGNVSISKRCNKVTFTSCHKTLRLKWIKSIENKVINNVWTHWIEYGVNSIQTIWIFKTNLAELLLIYNWPSSTLAIRSRSLLILIQYYCT